MKFKLPRISDKDEIISYIEEHYAHNEKNLSATTILTSMKFEDWVQKINDNINIPDEKWGRSLTYLSFDDNDNLIGFLNIRFDLSDELVQKYGHIGYGVRPSERKKGYATQMLKYALDKCKKLGMQKVIVGCYKQNIGSAKTIIKNGGKLILERDDYKEINEFLKIKLVNQF